MSRTVRPSKPGWTTSSSLPAPTMPMLLPPRSSEVRCEARRSPSAIAVIPASPSPLFQSTTDASRGAFSRPFESASAPSAPSPFPCTLSIAKCGTYPSASASAFAPSRPSRLYPMSRAVRSGVKRKLRPRKTAAASGPKSLSPAQRDWRAGVNASKF